MKKETMANVGGQRLLAGMVGSILMVLSGLCGYAQEPAEDRIQAHWKFDETAGLSAADSSGNGNAGTLNGFEGEEAQWVEGVDGGALQFGSGETYVEVPDSPSIGTELVDGFTVATWINPNVELAAGGGGNRVLEKTDSYFLLQGVAEGGMNFLVKQDGSNVTAGIGETLAADAWHHITGTFDGTDLRVYLNGELMDTVNVGADIDNPGGVLRIGSDDSGAFFNGAVDELTLWDGALTEEEIQQILANDGRPVTGPPEITAQPESATVYPGSKVTFSAEVGGTEPFEFQWLKDGEVVRGAASASFSLEDIQPEDAGDYRLQVTNEEGETESEAASLTVETVEGLETAQVAMWAFDEESGLTVADSSGNGLDGELRGFEGEESQWVSGQVGGALQFDMDQSNRVVIPDSGSVEFGQNLTVAFWINPETFGVGQDAGSFTWFESFLIRKGSELSVSIADDPSQPGTKAVMFGGTGGFAGNPGGRGDQGAAKSPANTVETGTWQHIAVVFTGDEARFYKDGFLVGDPQSTSLGDMNSLNLVLGNLNEGTETPRFYDGAMDEVGVWRRPLTENEILELAGREAEGSPVIVQQPTGETALEGASVSFSVRAEGKHPLSYQWRLNGQPIEGATSRVLTLTELSPEESGSYSVRITNEAGETTSSAAELTVNPIENVKAGLVAYWSFDNAEDGTLLDQSGNGHDGDMKNFSADPTVPGQIGSAFDFDGEDDFVVVPDDPGLDLEGEATVSFWMNPRSFGQPLSDWGRILRKEDNYNVFLREPTGTIWFRKGDLPPTEGTVQTEVWQHFAMVAEGDQVQFFKDGSPLGEPMVRESALGAVNDAPLVLGNFQADLEVARLHDGLLDDLGIWNRALNEQEIEGIFQNGTLGKPLTEEFEPLTIRSMELLPAEEEIVLTFFSPFPDREFAVERNAAIATGAWQEQSEVSFSELGQGEYEARFSMPSGDPQYFRVIALAPPGIFEADFEDGAGDWTHGGENDSWEVGAPSSGPGEAVSGENVFATNLDGNFQASTDAYLRSPTIDLTDVSRASLSFQEFRNVDSNIEFHSTVVRVLNAEDNSVITELGRDSGQTDGWQQRSFALGTDVLGNEVKIEFRLVTDPFNQLPGWYIDDVVIRPE